MVKIPGCVLAWPADPQSGVFLGLMKTVGESLQCFLEAMIGLYFLENKDCT